MLFQADDNSKNLAKSINLDCHLSVAPVAASSSSTTTDMCRETSVKCLEPLLGQHWSVGNQLNCSGDYPLLSLREDPDCAAAAYPTCSSNATTSSNNAVQSGV